MKLIPVLALFAYVFLWLGMEELDADRIFTGWLLVVLCWTCAFEIGLIAFSELVRSWKGRQMLGEDDE